MDNTQLFEAFSGAFEDVVRKAYTPLFPSLLLGKMRGPIRQRMMRNSDLVGEGLNAILTFKTQDSFGVAPLPRLGTFASGGTLGGQETEIALLRFNAGTQWELEDIRRARNSQSLIKNLVEAKMGAMPDAWSALDKVLTLGPSSGAIGVVNSVSGTTVTLRHTGNTTSGLVYDSPKDANRLFSDNMFVQFYNTASPPVPVGDPVFVTFLEYLSDEVTFNAVPGGVGAGYLIVPTDSLGLTQGLNLFGDGLFDAIDDDNTFQGIDRSQAANARFRSFVHAATNSGAIDYAQMSEFFRLFSGRLGAQPPKEAFTPMEVIRRYYEVVFRGQQMWTNPNANMQYVDGWGSVVIDRTRLIQDDELPMDQVVIPDLESITVQQAGPPAAAHAPRLIEQRPIITYTELYYGVLTMQNPRTSGRMTGLSLTA